MKMVDWSQLPEDVVLRIGDKIVETLDFFAFKTACKTWNYFLPKSRCKPRFPCLFYKNSNNQLKCLDLRTVAKKVDTSRVDAETRARNLEKARQRATASSSTPKAPEKQIVDSAIVPEVREKGASPRSKSKRVPSGVLDLTAEERPTKRSRPGVSVPELVHFAVPAATPSVKVGIEMAELMSCPGDGDMFDKLSQVEINRMLAGHLAQVSAWVSAAGVRAEKTEMEMKSAKDSVRRERSKVEDARSRIWELEARVERLELRKGKSARRLARLARRVGRRERALARETARADAAETDFYAAGQVKILKRVKASGVPYTDYLDDADVDVTVSDPEDETGETLASPHPEDDSEVDSAFSEGDE